ncbi:N-6 DNA methylase [Pseudogracilibacillus sp. SE30717A]|uniref:N-6 DNA methylase n=1 Tax=Pseudogracilibacillus sp. SE30717A TaxID=3098293 RepID=UPI00300E06DD
MQYEQAKEHIKKTINNMSGKYSKYNIFRDFIVLSACTISNSVDKVHFDEREKMYMDTIANYSKEEADKFAEMLAMITIGFSGGKMGDFLGELYMSMEFGNKHSGQFFTPYHLSKLTSQILGVELDEDGIVTLNEPSVGSGGMVVAYAETMKSMDMNYQTQLRVICNDIDYDVVKMCYIQLSLLGIDAVVMQGDTITLKMNETWYTPMHIWNRIRKAKESEVNEANEKTERMYADMKRILEMESEETAETKEPQLVGIPGQMSIFDYIE